MEVAMGHTWKQEWAIYGSSNGLHVEAAMGYIWKQYMEVRMSYMWKQ